MSEVFLRIYHSSAPAASPDLGGAAFMIDRLLILPTTIPELVGPGGREPWTEESE